MEDSTAQASAAPSRAVPAAVPSQGTPTQQAASERLRNILRAWGPLIPKPELKRIVSDQLPRFTTWLSDTATAPATFLQLTQALLADSEIPAIHKRPFLGTVWSKVDDGGIGIGGDSADLRYIQALLLAAWPRDKPLSALLIPAFFESAFAIQHRIPQEAQSLEDWRKDLSLQTDFQGPGQGPLIELLWWGQSGYCHRLEKPYRKLKDPSEILFYAAFEASERAISSSKSGTERPSSRKQTPTQILAIAPTAAYLARVLKDLGQNLDSQETLYGWLTRLHRILPERSGLKLGAALEAPLAEDPLGLPVNWVRWLKWQGQPFPSIETAQERIGFSLDGKIDMAEFAELVLRETMLDRFLEHCV